MGTHELTHPTPNRSQGPRKLQRVRHGAFLHAGKLRMIARSQTATQTVTRILFLDHCEILSPCETQESTTRGAHARTGSEVFLHVYDLHAVTRRTGLRLFHTGIQVYGSEVFYGSQGIQWCQSGKLDHAQRDGDPRALRRAQAEVAGFPVPPVQQKLP